jgi:hypothetical protein
MAESKAYSLYEYLFTIEETEDGYYIEFDLDDSSRELEDFDSEDFTQTVKQAEENPDDPFWNWDKDEEKPEEEAQ